MLTLRRRGIDAPESRRNVAATVVETATIEGTRSTPSTNA
jgi:hypothetical protein